MLTGRVFVLLSEERITLSKLRFEKARECLSDAALLAENESYKSLANRSYYAVFMQYVRYLHLTDLTVKSIPV